MPHVHIVSKDIFGLRMIPDNCLDMIYMSHVLEHVPRNQVLRTIKEMARVLKTGGALRISVPDFDHIVNIYQRFDNDIPLIAPALMGGQNYPFNFHYSIFNRAFLEDLLQKGGFNAITEWDPNNCEHHDFDDWASRKIHHQDIQLPISLNLEASREA